MNTTSKILLFSTVLFSISCSKIANDNQLIYPQSEEELYPEVIQKFEQDGLPYDNNYQTFIKPNNSSLKNDPVAALRPKLTFKWHGKINPNDPKTGTGGCNKPLGICITVSSLQQNETISIFERLQGIGSATMIFQNDTELKIIPDTYFSIDDKLEINSSIYFDSELANSIGFSAVEIINGIYQIDKSEGPFGSVIVNYKSTKK